MSSLTIFFSFSFLIIIIAGTLKEFKSTDSDPAYRQVLDIQTPVESIVQLKVGAQVMLLKNLNLNDGLVNGARGVVVKFSPEGNFKLQCLPSLLEVSATFFLNSCIPFGVCFLGLPVVKFKCGDFTIKPEKWSVKVMAGQLLTRRQIPLKLAWAFSIHKSQVLNVIK